MAARMDPPALAREIAKEVADRIDPSGILRNRRGVPDTIPYDRRPPTIIGDRVFVTPTRSWTERELQAGADVAEFRREFLGKWENRITEDAVDQIVKSEYVNRPAPKPKPEPVAALSRFAVLDFGDEK